MEDKINVYEVSLKDIEPLVEPIKKYFGLNHPNLELDLDAMHSDKVFPDRTYYLVKNVDFERLGLLLNKYFPELESERKDYYQNLLWLFCNLYYGKNYDAYEDFINNEIGQEENIWNCIRGDILELYVFMQRHKENEEFSISFGKGKENKVKLHNSFKWFQGLLDNHLFHNCIPDITSIEQAKEELAGKAGRPESSKVVNAVINGLATMFKEDGVITATAPKELLCFIYDILLEMNLAKPGDKVLELDNIKAQISNFKKPGKDARFFTPEIRKCSIEDLKEAPLHEKALDWLLKKPQK